MSWRERLKEHMDAEDQDHMEYMEIADEAENEHCCHEAGVLRDIAQEEAMHHKLLAEMM